MATIRGTYINKSIEPNRFYDGTVKFLKGCIVITVRTGSGDNRRVVLEQTHYHVTKESSFSEIESLLTDALHLAGGKGLDTLGGNL